MFLAVAAEVRVVIIVLAIRVQQMRALEDITDASERRRLARETLEVFAPLANRLGIWQLKIELENGALREIDPDGFRALEELLAETRQERQSFIDESIRVLEQKLSEEGIKATVKGRAKHLYGIYKKMQRKQVGFDQIHDVSAVRIIVAQAADCYAALGLVHSIWMPVLGFEDYIARRKNLYQSAHLRAGPKPAWKCGYERGNAPTPNMALPRTGLTKRKEASQGHRPRVWCCAN
jgi:GTP pyrophosphokinase